MRTRINKCRKHPELEKLISKYKYGVPMDGDDCPVCSNIETLRIISEQAKR